MSIRRATSEGAPESEKGEEKPGSLFVPPAVPLRACAAMAQSITNLSSAQRFCGAIVTSYAAISRGGLAWLSAETTIS